LGFTAEEGGSDFRLSEHTLPVADISTICRTIPYGLLPVSNICREVQAMHHRGERLYLSYISQIGSYWKERLDQTDFEILNPKQARYGLEDLLQHNSSLYNLLGPRDKSILVVELARLLFNLLGSSWIREFSLSHLSLFEDENKRRFASHPFISWPVTRLPPGTEIDTSIGELVLSFGLRMLEIQSAQPVPHEFYVSTEQDYETKESIPIESSLVMRKFRAFLDEHGAVEEKYLQIARDCLDFEECVQQLHIPSSLDRELKQHVAFHKLILQPLLDQLVAKWPRHAHQLLPVVDSLRRGSEETHKRTDKRTMRRYGNSTHASAASVYEVAKATDTDYSADLNTPVQRSDLYWKSYLLLAREIEVMLAVIQRGRCWPLRIDQSQS
jgi:hypothetical protein